MLKRLGQIVMALSLLLIPVTPTLATHATGDDDDPVFWGYFYNSAINDSNGNGVPDLHICYVDQLLINNRAMLNDAARVWSQAVGLEIISRGANCSNVNIQVRLGPTDSSCNVGDTIADATGGVPHSFSEIRFNWNCNWDFSRGGEQSGKPKAWSSMVHEVGHTLGLGHEGDNGSNGHSDSMDSPGPCSWGILTTLSENDARSIRARYPGLNWTWATFGLNVGCDMN